MFFLALQICFSFAKVVFDIYHTALQVIREQVSQILYRICCQFVYKSLREIMSQDYRNVQ